MSLIKKAKILIILTAAGFGLLLAIMLLGAAFPGEPVSGQAPWFVWAAICESMAFIIADVVIGIIVRKKDKESCK